MFQLTDEQENMINSVREYTYDFRDLEYNSDELTIKTELSIYNATQFSKSVDLGGLTVYFKNDELVAFYDYEMQCGHVFETETV